MELFISKRILRSLIVKCIQTQMETCFNFCKLQNKSSIGKQNFIFRVIMLQKFAVYLLIASKRLVLCSKRHKILFLKFSVELKWATGIVITLSHAPAIGKHILCWGFLLRQSWSNSTVTFIFSPLTGVDLLTTKTHPLLSFQVLLCQ